MRTSFNINKKCWNRKFPESVSQHDLVFQSPADDPTFGLPIGDGDVGCLIWTENTKIISQINKTDLFSFSPNESFNGGTLHEEEKRTSLRHGARLIIDFGMPCFDILYQKNYEGRLSLADATASITSATPFSDIQFSAYGSHEYGVTVMECKSECADFSDISVSLERWGSRTFAYWYAFGKRDPSAGLNGTKSLVDKNTLIITQNLGTTSFCVMVYIDSKNLNNTEVFNSRTSRGIISANKVNEFKLYITVTHENSGNEALKAAQANIENALKNSQSIYDVHKDKWKNFWDKSFVDIENDYIENLWYLNLYYANSECRGKFVPHFCNGIWGFERDFVPWNYIFHYNTQLHTFPLDVCNHPELLETYYAFRRNTLEKSQEYSLKNKNIEGAFYADVTDRLGNGDDGTKDNCSCGALIAISMYQHYLYSGDKNFLKEIALPVMVETAKFYKNSLIEEDDGFLHIHSTQAYEGTPLFNDSITDHAAMRSLFSALYAVTEEKDYKDMLEKLAPFKTVKMSEYEYDGKNIIIGIGKGKKALGDCVLSVGRDIDSGKQLRKNHNDPREAQIYGFPDTELSLVFPAGVIGLADEKSELFSALVNQARIHWDGDVGKNFIAESDSFKSQYDICMGWCMEPIYLARLGLAEELEKSLINTADTWIVYPQGFGIYGPFESVYYQHNMRWAKLHPTDAEHPENKYTLPAWRFRHFDYETLPIISTAVNEMLLQSYDGVIRIFPAVCKNRKASFKLCATGGFVVNAEKNGDGMFICIESLLGNECVLKNPYGQKYAWYYSYNDGKLADKKKIYAEKRRDEEVFVFSTNSNMEYVICDTEFISYDENTNDVFCRNMSFKECGKSFLGSEKQY